MEDVVRTTEFEPSQVEGSGWDAAAEQEGIQELLRRFMEAWGRNDAAALAGTFVSTGDLLNSRGHMAMGREQVEQLLAREFATMMRGTRATTTLTHLRFLAPDTAHADVDMVVDRPRQPDGTLPPQLPMHVAFLARKEAPGRWGFVAVRPYLLPPKA